MRCTSPKTVGFKHDGKTISWSPKNSSKEYATFQLPCGKCISCRLEYARQWAVRCVHEASMYENNSFITLTYDDHHLKSDKLIYSDFQKFMRRLRANNPQLTIGMFVTGEYGEQRKRPHWHAIIFNWRPTDIIHKYTNDRGDKVYSSNELTDLWPYGLSELGSVTFESAGYCARYAAKKLVHGKDQDHEYQPISKKSSKQAIGKKWLEKHWPDVFNYGHLIMHDGSKAGIPRYYEKWLLKYQPDAWIQYRALVKSELTKKLIEKEETKKQQEKEINLARTAQRKPLQITENQARKFILEKKFNDLQTKLKL